MGAVVSANSVAQVNEEEENGLTDGDNLPDLDVEMKQEELEL